MSPGAVVVAPECPGELPSLKINHGEEYSLESDKTLFYGCHATATGGDDVKMGELTLDSCMTILCKGRRSAVSLIRNVRWALHIQNIMLKPNMSSFLINNTAFRPL